MIVTGDDNISGIRVIDTLIAKYDKPYQQILGKNPCPYPLPIGCKLHQLAPAIVLAWLLTSAFGIMHESNIPMAFIEIQPSSRADHYPQTIAFQMVQRLGIENLNRTGHRNRGKIGMGTIQLAFPHQSTVQVLQ